MIVNNWEILSRITKNSRKYLKCRCKCGTIRISREYDVLNGRSKSCGCLHKEKSKKYRAINHSGYVLIRRPKHPNARSDGRILEHVYIMSQHLGRPLEPEENVHHINGDKTDNRLENLELWTKPQPSGIRVKDAIKHAYEILEKYEQGFGQYIADTKSK